MLNAPRRIYVAFGEHPAAGVCVCVCSSKLVVLLLGCLCVYVCVCVCSFVCVCGWLCVDSCLSLCFLGWLVVCFLVLFCTFSCFTKTFGDRVMLFLHFGGPWGSIVTPGAPFCHPWWKMQRVFSVWRDLEAQFVDPWGPCGPPWIPL